MEWLSKILVTVLVVTGVFVAVISGCRWSATFVHDGGSCTNVQLDAPTVPHATLGDVALPDARVDLLAILVAVAALVVPIEAARRTRSVHMVSRGQQRPVEFSMRD